MTAINFNLDKAIAKADTKTVRIGGKLVFLSIWQIATKTSIVRQNLFSLPDTLAPSYAVGAILNEVSYITNRHAGWKSFTFWSSNTTDNQMDMDTTLIYLHFD